MTDDAPDENQLTDVTGLRYADAVAELEAILAELEDDSVDVDVLADRVARAAVLIRLCRSRITGTRIEVERIVADLDAPDPAPTGADGGPAADAADAAAAADDG